MLENKKMTANAGQIFYPPLENLDVPVVPYDRAKELPTKEGGYQFQEKWKNSGYRIVGTDENKFLPDVTAEMLDWFWANLEKVYYLWAPGEHLSFQWEKAPNEVGYEGSIEFLYETNHLYPVRMKRISMDNYPFTECLEHCWISDGMFGGTEYGMRLIHMYEDMDGGVQWTTIKLVHESQAEWIRNYRKDADPVKTKNHNEYEAGRFKDFLPQIYALWKGHPDPCQNVHFDLRTRKNKDGSWSHISQNLPPERVRSGKKQQV